MIHYRHQLGCAAFDSVTRRNNASQMTPPRFTTLITGLQRHD